MGYIPSGQYRHQACAPSTCTAKALSQTLRMTQPSLGPSYDSNGNGDGSGYVHHKDCDNCKGKSQHPCLLGTMQSLPARQGWCAGQSSPVNIAWTSLTAASLLLTSVALSWQICKTTYATSENVALRQRGYQMCKPGHPHSVQTSFFKGGGPALKSKSQMSGSPGGAVKGSQIVMLSLGAPACYSLCCLHWVPASIGLHA